MKKFIKPALLAGMLSLGASANAGYIVTNYSSGSGTTQFNTANGYDQGYSLDAQPTNASPANQWQTTDPYDAINDTGSTSQVQFIPGYTGGAPAAGNSGVYFGGYDPTVIVPGVSNPSLFYNFNSAALPGALLDTVTFTSDFALQPSSIGDPSFPDNDTFGYSFWTAGGPGVGSLLAKIQFSYLNPPPAGAANNGTFGVSVDGGATLSELSYGSIYTVSALFTSSGLEISMANVTAQTNGSGYVTNYSRGPLVSLATVAGVNDPSAFESASVDWQLASGNPAQPGANYMMINSAQIETLVTPEPGTVLAGAFLLSAVVYTSIRRRKSTAAVTA